MVSTGNDESDRASHLAGGGLDFERERQQAAQETSSNPHDNQQGAKAKPPSQRYSNYDHPTEEEHRTAEQFNWRYALILNVFIATAAGAAAIFAAFSFYETKRQADLISQEQRAWIEEDQFSLSQSLVFTKDAVTFAVSVTLKNVGHMPATSVWTYLSGVPWSPIVNVISEGKKICKEKQRPKFGQGIIGSIIFPDQNGSGKGEINIPMQTAKDALAAIKAAGDPSDVTSIYVVGCVVYKSLGDDQWHSTSIMHEIDQKGIGGEDFRGFSFTPQEVPIGNLIILDNATAQGDVN